MTRDDEIPESATVEPPILTPEEDAVRAHLREDREEMWADLGVHADPARPHDPLRQPGESSSPPGFRS
jgi:hypothetical protein